MDDPIRFVDDSAAPAELRAALRRAPRAHLMEEKTRARLGARVARLTAVPVSIAALISVKSAAALGIGLGLVTASVSVGVFEYVERHADTAKEGPRVSAAVRPAPGPRSALEAAPVSEPIEELDPVPDLPSRTAPPLPTPLPSSGGLAEESALLESARRALADSPGQALGRVREHAQRFPRGQLASERSLLEVDALYRLGRRAEARAAAQRLLAQGGDSLYTTRVRRLLDKIENAR